MNREKRLKKLNTLFEGIKNTVKEFVELSGEDEEWKNKMRESIKGAEQLIEKNKKGESKK